MPLFTIHARDFDGSGQRDIGRLRLVREGVSRAALAFGPLWLLWHRLWLALLCYAAFLGGLLWLFNALEFPQTASAGLIVLVNLFLALEGPGLLRRKLDWLNYRFAGVTGGASYDEAERKAAALLVEEQGKVSAQSSDIAGKNTAQQAYSPVIGLFPEDGSRV